jgi:hypothetical protein
VVNQIPGNPVNGVQSNPSFRPTVDTTVTLNGYPSIKFVGGFTGQSFAFPTGVGRPVVDMMRKENLDPVPITITGGDQATPDNRGWRVPKRDLVGVMQVLLQNGRFKVANALPLASVLTQELLRFRVKIDPLTAHDSLRRLARRRP